MHLVKDAAAAGGVLQGAGVVLEVEEVVQLIGGRRWEQEERGAALVGLLP